MKKLLSVLFFYLLIISCQSQKVVEKQNDENKASYFSGTWTLVQKNYKEDGETKVFDLHECMKRYELIFKNIDEKSILTKIFATGKDCEIKSKSDDFLVLINDGSFSYMEYDLKRQDHYKIYSQNKFSIIYGDIINGKVTEIEDFYQRKK